MKRTSYFLLALISANLFSEEASEMSDEITLNPVAMQKMERGFRTRGSGSKKERVAALEAQMNEVFTDTVRGDFGAKAASARPRVDGYRLYVKGDLLFWKEYIGGDNYAFTDQDITSAFVGTNKHLNFSWSWGARGELGYHFAHDSWDGLLRYTWLISKASNHHNQMRAPIGGATQTLYTSFATANPTYATARWRTKLNVLDAEFGKDYFYNQRVACKPFFGLKTAWIAQKMSATYEGFPNSFSTTRVSGQNDFWGVGPWGGMTSTAYFAQWMNLFCSFGGSLMVGSFEVMSKELQGVTQTIDLKANNTQIAPMIQAALGLGWDYMFNRNRNHIAVKTSYEILYWWRQNQLLHYGNPTSSTAPPMGRYGEDIAFHGCTLDFTIDF